MKPYSVTAVLVALVAGSVLTACSSKERAPDTARAGSTAGATPPGPANSVAATTPTTAALPGTLTKPIDQYTGDEFYDFVQKLKWGGGVEKARKCKGDPACSGTKPSKETKVRVDAVDGQDSITTTALPANGVVAIRAINRGSLDEERYGFKADKKFEYYVVVSPGTGEDGTWRLEELDTTPGARRHTSFGTGAFQPCNHPFKPGRVNRANFYTCDDSRAADSVQTSNLLMFAASDPIWFDCARGCCILK